MKTYQRLEEENFILQGENDDLRREVEHWKQETAAFRQTAETLQENLAEMQSEIDRLRNECDKCGSSTCCGGCREPEETYLRLKTTAETRINFFQQEKSQNIADCEEIEQDFNSLLIGYTEPRITESEVMGFLQDRVESGHISGSEYCAIPPATVIYCIKRWLEARRAGVNDLRQG